MTNVVLKVREDVCLATGRDPQATELLEKMALYGDVSFLEDEVAAVKAEYQRTIDNLTKQIESIAEQKLTQDEIVFLNFYRERIAANVAEFQKRIKGLETKLDEIAEDYKKKIAQIRDLLPEA